MKVKLYAVLDTCTGVYDGPVPFHNDQTAMRAFHKHASTEGTPINNSPSDFSIWRVGEWNDADGSITPETKTCIAYAIDLLTPQEET